MHEVYIYDAKRTPRGKGKADGSLAGLKPVELLSGLLKEIAQINNIKSAWIDDVIMGCVTQCGEQGADIAKAAVIDAGYSDDVCGMTLSRFCGSGLESVNQAAAYIKSGYRDAIIAGGIESMSRVKMGQDGGALFDDMDFIRKHKLVPQGISADLIATKWGFTRNMLDDFAVESHMKASKAQNQNAFNKSILPVKKENEVLLMRDECIRSNTTREILAGLKPSFEKLGIDYGFDNLALKKYPEVSQINHVHHAGNSSGIVDGASAVIIGNKEFGIKADLKPRARLVEMSITGTEPTIMLIGPGPASLKALKRAGMNVSDIDLAEVNEAFAAVPLKFQQDTGMHMDKINVNGGAIALGHPLGATGGMLLGTVLDELETRDLNTGLVTLCIGGGMGIATIIERV